MKENTFYCLHFLPFPSSCKSVKLDPLHNLTFLHHVSDFKDFSGRDKAVEVAPYEEVLPNRSRALRSSAGMQPNFLPIAKRELRAAARHRNTHRLRWATCALAIVISIIWLVSNPRPAMAAKFVGSVFALQTVCAFGFALLVGAFLISDCISEEKRDGTLSLR
jgi:hypothetical protein